MKEQTTTTSTKEEPEPSESKSVRRRRLTAEQLAHKRELDRRAQRNNREKTRSKIAHLETLVEALQDRDHEKLIGQLDDQKTEIERLKAMLNSVANIVCATDVVVSKVKAQASEEIQPQGENNNEPPCSHSAEESPIKVEDWDTPVPTSEIEHSIQEDPSATLLDPEPVGYSPIPEPVQQVVARTEHHRESITQMATAIFNKTDLEGRMWYICGVILRHILATTSPSQISIVHDEDIAIRAVFDGWSSVVERYPLDRGWQWLKEVDERIYFHRWQPFRLMHLRNCRLIFLRQMFRGCTNWRNPLPAFFAPRPAEENIDHDPLIEYFPWPGLRERMLFRPTMFATNKFMDNLRCEIDFLWGTDPHKLYNIDPISQTYSYSNFFHDQIVDLRFYHGTVDFFENFPELKTDIPLVSNALTTLRISDTDDNEETIRKRRVSVHSSRTFNDPGYVHGT